MNNLKQEHADLLNKAFKRILSSGWFILGPEVESFEKSFANYLGSKYCIGVGNGLEAIQISLMALEIGQGDEVITTPISAAATTLAILATSAKPVFVDTTDDGLINIDLIPQAITKKTKAIIPVHLYGNSIDLEKLQKICKKNNLFLIEDASQAHGSSFKGKKLGTFGDINCFSFYPTKNLGALGDGGAIVTNNQNLAEICAAIRDYGQKGKYHHVRFGLNSRLDELQAAFLSVKLKFLDHDNEKRRKLAKRYTKNLLGVPIEIVATNNIMSNFHPFVIKTKRRLALQKFLTAQGIPTLIHYPKIIPDQPFWKKNHKIENLLVARQYVNSCLSLPLEPQMSFEKVDFISSKIVQFFSK